MNSRRAPCLTLFLLILIEITVCEIDIIKFPDGFSIGAATSSYQVEGAWNVDGKGESVWDRIVHTRSWAIADHSTGDVACDTYHKYKEDIQLMKNLGLNHYRFSISWPRILPTGFSDNINYAGIQYYSDFIDELLENGIEPYVTLYHWDHPQPLEELGGWTNDLIVEWFTDYARIIFDTLGPKIKFITTINEPNIFCLIEYAGGSGKNFSHYGEYLCGHNALKAHARVYHMYDKEYRKDQKGIIGFVLSCQWFYSLHKDDDSDNVAFEFNCGWLANPVFTKKGDYPPVMRQRIDENSRAEGLRISRLPTFSKYWIDYIRGTYDYFGLNHYTTLVTYSIKGNKTQPWYDDSGIKLDKNVTWEQAASPWLNVVPEGFGHVLRNIKHKYGNPPIYILENGYSDNRTTTEDPERINYLYTYMKEMLKAIDDGCDVKCYTVWSLFDNFEWDAGYTQGFGLYSVDFNDPQRKRTPKSSVFWFSNVTKNGGLPVEMLC